MVEQTSTIVWANIVFLIGGGIGGSILTFILGWWRDRRFKNREEFVQLATQRVESISKAMPYYNQLAMNAWNLGWNLIEEKSDDYIRLMFYLCNTVYFRDKIVKEFGDLQFADLEAERIINDIWQGIRHMLVQKFGHINLSRFISLLENNMPYHRFHDTLYSDENKELYNEFIEWLSNGLSQQDLEQLERTMWYSQLIMLEANHVYHLWYGTEPPLILRPKLKQYLRKPEYKDYYNRITSFHKSFFGAKQSILIANYWPLSSSFLCRLQTT